MGSGMEGLRPVLSETGLVAEGGNGGPQTSGGAPHSTTPPPSQSDPLGGCGRGKLGGGLGERRGHRNRMIPPRPNVHITLKKNARSHLFINSRRKTVPLPRKVLAKNRLKRDKSRRDQWVKKGKASRTGATGTSRIGKGGVLSAGRLYTGSDQLSGRTIEDTNDTKRLDHPGGCPGGGVAPDGPRAHHRCLRGRPQSSPPPLLGLLPTASRVRNKRNGASLAPATTTAHQPSMGDDPPSSGEAERLQSSGPDRGAPVAVGLVVTHPGSMILGPPYIISGSLYKD